MPRGYLTKLVTLIVPDAKAEREARLSESMFMMTIVINTAQADMTVGWRAPAEDAPGLIGCSRYLGAKCRSGWRVAAALFSYSARCPSACSGTARQGQTTPAAALSRSPPSASSTTTTSSSSSSPSSYATMRGPPSAPTASLAASTLIAFPACRRGDGGQRQDQGCTGR
jgi:hypothetical protein